MAIVGSGWHPPLFREEVRALLGPIETLHPRVVFVTQSDDVIDRISGASLVDVALSHTSRMWTYGQEAKQEEVASYVADWAESFLPDGTFAVRSKRLGTGISGLSRRELESDVGAKISSYSRSVDLEKPDHEVVVVLAGSDDASSHWDDANVGQLVVWGLRDEVSNGPYTGKSPTERPFFKPVTLDPRLARLMISLSFNRGAPSAVVDPFCGTGGIAIEASMLGLEVFASDLDPRMVEGTKTNLEWVGGSGRYLVEECPADRIHQKWGKRLGCSFVFDPPYGRNAWTSGDGLEILLNSLDSAKEMSPDGTVCTMLPSNPEALLGPVSDGLHVMGMEWGSLRSRIEETGWAVSMCAPVRVHKSLSRLVVLCHPAD